MRKGFEVRAVRFESDGERIGREEEVDVAIDVADLPDGGEEGTPSVGGGLGGATAFTFGRSSGPTRVGGRKGRLRMVVLSGFCVRSGLL